MNKVCVTGASGFIGAYLCRALVKKNIFVNGIDNNLRGSIGPAQRNKK
jgi:nucleoside-diphosphate-sugar epimerase